MTCKLLVTEKLTRTLLTHDIPATGYSPAYGGESVGLDLYNCAGKDIHIPTIQDSTGTNLDEATENYFWEAAEWHAFYEGESEKEVAVKCDKARIKTLIPTGLHIALPKNYAGIILERGSITKTPLKVRAGVIDPGYTGEIFVNMVNLSYNLHTIKQDAKLPVQLVIFPVVGFEHITQLQFDDIVRQAARTTGKIGSSD